MLDQRGETRDAKWQQKEPEGLPATRCTRGVAAHAQQQGEANDRGDTQRVEPDGRRPVKVVEDRNETPKQIAPKNYPPGRDRGEVSEHGTGEKLHDDARGPAKRPRAGLMP